MLVLSRKVDEDIIIGTGPDKVVIKVCEIIRPDKVRLGIEAPANVVVDRREIRERKIANGELPHE